MFRIGQGYDVHRLTEGRRLILGGVDIPHPKGLLGHSDGDVLLHAVMDALLGAAAMGDIGKHFPDSDPAYKGADSLKLLEKVCRLLETQGYEIVNIDATLVLEQPRVACHIPQMREHIAAAAGCESERISVKASSEEGLGFTGSGEGVAAAAVALISGNKYGIFSFGPGPFLAPSALSLYVACFCGVFYRKPLSSPPG
ncbi:MAG: 2-C-methyl-D-erythritol 2,4-cyclodiphosphate synthase [Candidatus Marinimicrobia bacterium]|nr:2-C-methyl-D-erythritol 2,4-cyclodiphosphate synthase [Candidatus Neomarinimicrobiota bacterium]